MSLLQDSQIESSVYLCSFQCTIKQANVCMKFPCSYFVQWSTISKKSATTSSKHLPDQRLVHFDQKITLQTQIVYNNKSSQYSKKESFLQLYLVSKSRPDQNKLVGRVTIDLAKVVNFQMYAQPTEFKLNFCSVQATITLQFQLIGQILTTLKAHQLDKSSFIDYISQIVLKTPKSNSLNKNFHQQSPKSLNNKQANSLKQSVPIKNGPEVLHSDLLRDGKNSAKNQAVNVRTPSIQMRGKDAEIQTREIRIETIQKDYRPINDFFGPDTQQIKNAYPAQESSSLKQQPNEKTQKLNSQQCSEPVQSPTFLQRNQNDSPIEKQATYQFLNDKQKALQQYGQLRQKESLQDRLQNLQAEKQSQIQLIKAEKLQLEKVILEMQQKEGNLKQRNQHLQNEINTKNAIIKSLEEELNEKENRCQKLMQMVESLSHQNQQKPLQTFSNNLSEKQIAYLQERVKLFQSQICQLNLHLQQSERKQSSYEQRFIDLEQMVKTLEFQNDQLKEQLRSQLQAREQLQSKLINAVSSNNVLQAKSNQALASLKKKSFQTQAMIKQIEKTMQGLVQKDKWSKSQIERLNQTNRKIACQNQQILQSQRKKQLQCVQLKSVLQQTISSHSKQKAAQQNGRIIELEQDIKRVSEQAQFLKQSLEMLQRQTTQQIQDLKHQNANQNNHIKVLQDQNQELKNQKANQSNHIKVLQDQIQRLYNGIQQRQSMELLSNNDIEKVKQTVDQQVNQHKEKINELENKLILQKQENEELLFQIKSIQNEKSTLIQQLKLYQVENFSLNEGLKQLQKIKTNDNEGKTDQNLQVKLQQYDLMIAKLNGNLQQQINQNNELSQTILSYMQKQAKMKETLSVLEQQSKEIFVLFQEKEHNQETYQKMIQDLQKQIKRLSTNFYQIHSEQVSPSKSGDNSPTSLKQIKQKWQNSNDQMAQINKKLQQLNEQLNQELLNLKIMYNRQKEQSEIQISKLNGRLLEASNHYQQRSLSQKLSELEKTIRNKDLQVQITKSKLRQSEQAKAKIQGEFDETRKLMEQLQEQKFDIQSARNQKDIRILQLEEQLNNLKIKGASKMDSPLKKQPCKNQQLVSLITLISQKLSAKNTNGDWQQLIQNILDKSLLGEDIAKLINIQQKSRLLSKQLQKLKSNILKGGIKNQLQKLNFMNLIKTCESIIAEIITAAQALSLNQSSFL